MNREPTQATIRYPVRRARPLPPAIAALLACMMTASCSHTQRPPRHLIVNTQTTTPIFGKSHGAEIQARPPVRRQELQVSIVDGMLTCRLYNAPLDQVLERIGAERGLEFVHRGRLHANVSANLQEVPVAEALEILFQATPYEFEQLNDVYLIARPDEG